MEVIDYVGLAVDAVGSNKLLTASAVLNLVFAINAKWGRLLELAIDIWEAVKKWKAKYSKS